MTSRERVLKALDLGVPDKVPFIEIVVDEELGRRMIGREKPVYNNNIPSHEGYNPWLGFIGQDYYNPLELCERFHLDGWGFSLSPAFYSEEIKTVTPNGDRTFVTNGKIKTRKDLKNIRLGNLKDDLIFDYIKRYIEKYKGDYATFIVTNMGTDPVLLSLGLETFSYLLADDPGIIEEMLDIYTDWAAELTRKLCQLDIDFIWYGDDIAYKNGLMFSPEFYRNTCVPRLDKVAKECTKPSIYHTDGNFLSVTEDLLSLGFNGLHPMEPGSVDIFDFKKKYQDRVCTIGNIDLNTLGIGSREETYNEVREKVTRLSAGGSYIMSSSNTLTLYCKDENVETMIQAFEEYR